MPALRLRKRRRQRVGRVSYFWHHGAWHLYYRDGGRQVRRRIGTDRSAAARVAAEVNAQLACELPAMFSFTPLTVAELRQRFLNHHEHVICSSLATVSRYRAATKHLENFAGSSLAHRVDPDQFIRHLRTIRVSPNGHSQAARRPLREKGLLFILETCRSMYGYAAKKRHLPPYTEISFTQPGLRRRRIEDARPVYVFDETSELTFFKNASDWAFPIFFTLAKTGLRPGELIHALIEDLDLEAGWCRVRNKPGLGWLVKTRRERSVPLVPELIALLRQALSGRTAGPVFLRRRFADSSPLASYSYAALVRLVEQRITEQEHESKQLLGRIARARVARLVWREAGAVRPEAIRKAFLATTSAIGLPQVTCPKCWRHTFATLLQEANVDPLIRQITLGHAPEHPETSALGMTGLYTHTRPGTQKREILRALRLWPQSLEFAHARMQGVLNDE